MFNIKVANFVGFFSPLTHNYKGEETRDFHYNKASYTVLITPVVHAP